MRTFDELSTYERAKAIENTYHDLVTQIAEGVIVIDGHMGNKVRNALRLVANSTDPAASYKAVASVIGEEIKSIAKGAAEDATYDEYGNVIYEIC